MKIGPLVLVCAAALALPACREEEPQSREAIRPVRAMTVSSEPALPLRRFPGRAKAAQEATLAFEVAGRLTALPVKVGDVVEEGAVLAALDQRDFESALAAAKAEEARSRAQYERMEKAAAMNAVSRQDLSDARAAWEAAQAQVDIRQKALEDATLRAPYRAVVVATYFQNFEAVQPKQPALRILNPSRIEMVVDVPEEMINLVRLDVPVVVAFDAAPGVEIRAEVSEIGAEANASTRTYPVTLSMDQPEGDLKILPGMAGKAWRAADNRAPAAGAPAGAGFAVPLTALAPGPNGGSVVWVIDPATGLVSARDVEVGSLTSDGVLVIRGLSGGEVIATAGARSLKDGQKVRIVEGE
ncbi:MAG: efflux RND transporter periplasmic adaptor subunit [Alphaproteobacteria bacterium]|jgi:RND family efflux transporter MFP subunit|nr:efflux RND transporter periplasmic adaptor subunit [Alphaproteobacteria bacterium]